MDMLPAAPLEAAGAATPAVVLEVVGNEVFIFAVAALLFAASRCQLPLPPPKGVAEPHALKKTWQLSAHSLEVEKHKARAQAVAGALRRALLRAWRGARAHASWARGAAAQVLAHRRCPRRPPAVTATSWWARLSARQRVAISVQTSVLVISEVVLVWAATAPGPEEWLAPCEEVVQRFRLLGMTMVFCAGALLNCEAFFQIPVM
mmetsp:Transcript_51161/g.141703  ORF Transcript_51161/g.141703 Transcript_51161/m.141703 type:complete len:205 (-) Transcript_51161:145-759(-)|eukprot:CAMPEP_0179043876 /NCGR_PEP_ID=MMETSP0796-20121207/17386_1 /TAXON_ID=73915 /ORGANISM="Pyrodinium bahamense, Strain pbaha01" /LENGTH=204 /DNA_ID=CAMNT_0020740261 /DNA_START=72 /DNA_END=686 /DNA_ORIENTATION=+